MKTDQQLLSEYCGTDPLLLTAPVLDVFMDYGTISGKSRGKTIILVVRTAFAWVTAGQATAQLFDSADAVVAAHGAVTQLATAAAPNALVVGAVQNVGAAAQTSLAINAVFRWDVATISALQWPFANLGVELKFPSAPSVGKMDILVV